MLYTREEILMEADYSASLAKIDVMADMMLESFMDDMDYAEYYDDEDAFTEAAGNIGNTILTKIKSIIQKIKDYVSSTIASIKEKKRQKKLDKMMGADFKRMVEQLDAGMLKGKTVPDVVTLSKLADASMKYIDAAVKRYNKEMQTFGDAINYEIKTGKQKKAAENLLNFCRTTMDGYGKIENAVDTVKDIPLTKENIYRMVEAGITCEDDFAEINKKLDQCQKDMESMVRNIVSAVNSANVGYKVDSSLNKYKTKSMREYAEYDEEVEESVDDVEYDEVYEEKFSFGKSEPEPPKKAGIMAKVNAVVSSVTSTLTSFVKKHGKLILKITAALVAIAGLIYGGKKVADNIKDPSGQFDKRTAKNRAKYDKAETRAAGKIRSTDDGSFDKKSFGKYVDKVGKLDNQFDKRQRTNERIYGVASKVSKKK